MHVDGIFNSKMSFSLMSQILLMTETCLNLTFDYFVFSSQNVLINFQPNPNPSSDPYKIKYKDYLAVYNNLQTFKLCGCGDGCNICESFESN